MNSIGRNKLTEEKIIDRETNGYTYVTCEIAIECDDNFEMQTVFSLSGKVILKYYK